MIATLPQKQEEAITKYCDQIFNSGAETEEFFYRLGPVSYTHLDVYKRQEQIDRANQADIVSFLQSQGEQLTHAGQEYRCLLYTSRCV